MATSPSAVRATSPLASGRKPLGLPTVGPRGLRTRRTLVGALAVLAISGCTIQPQVMTQQENSSRAADLLARATRDQERIVRPIDLYEAMARAIKYNLDYRVEVMEKALRVSELDLKRMEMLPKVVASIDYNGRNNDSGGSSRSLLTGETSLVSSTSSERHVLASDMTLSWDVLDFGLSYVRAQQAGGDILIAEERKRKALVRIVEDVRTAYWRAVGAQRMLGQVQLLERATLEALQSARAQAATQNTAPLAPLTYQREILIIRREAQTLQRDLSVAKQQLAALMNLPPDAKYDLAASQQDHAFLKPLTIESEEMLRLAVENRPELREVAYQLRNNQWESKAATLRVLPSLRLFLGLNWNSNSYLYNDNWVGAGAQASWNLMNVFRLPAEQQRVRAQNALLDTRALALTTAVGVQVYVARARYELRRRELETVADLQKVQKDIMVQIDAGHQAGRLSRQTLLREQLNSVVAEVRHDLALADLQNAFANVYASMGVDVVDGTVSSNDSVDVLAGKLRDQWREREDLLTRERP